MRNKQHRWTRSEDRLLRSALKEGKSASELARNLGVSPTVVYARKVYLGLKGRFARAGKKVAQTTRLIQTMEAGNFKYSNSGDSFQLEDNVEITFRRGKYDQARTKMRNTFENMEVGQSFVIPSTLAYIARKIAQEEFPSMKVRVGFTNAEKNWSRVYRSA